MNFINFADIRVLLISVLITAVVLSISAWKKKSIFSGVMLLLYTFLLIFHVISMSSVVNVFVDLLGMAVSITTYLIVDEVEIRRKKINQVFEDRYKD